MGLMIILLGLNINEVMHSVVWGNETSNFYLCLGYIVFMTVEYQVQGQMKWQTNQGSPVVTYPPRHTAQKVANLAKGESLSGLDLV